MINFRFLKQNRRYRLILKFLRINTLIFKNNLKYLYFFSIYLIILLRFQIILSCFINRILIHCKLFYKLIAFQKSGQISKTQKQRKQTNKTANKEQVIIKKNFSSPYYMEKNNSFFI